MYISFVAGLLAGLLTTFAGWLLSLLREKGMIDLPQFIFWPLTGAVVFGLLFFFFDKIAWRSIGIRSLVGIPDVSGSWSVVGVSFDRDNQPQRQWEGKLLITQRYEKIFLCLKTTQSESWSISAAIVPEGIGGYRLIYGYRNQPKPGESDMQAHIGHCNIFFESSLASAEGTYFNGGGRFTQGKITLRRLSNGAKL